MDFIIYFQCQAFKGQIQREKRLGRWKHARHYSSLAHLQCQNNDQTFATFRLQHSLFQYVCVCVCFVSKKL